MTSTFLGTSKLILNGVIGLGRHYHLDPQVFGKIAKRHFFQDIQNSFNWATGIGLEPHQNFFRKKFQQMRSLEPSKILAKTGCCWQAD